MRIIRNLILRRPLLALVLALALSYTCVSVRAAEWTAVGKGELNGSGSFDVLIDRETIERKGEDVRFWQAHVFYRPQTLPSGQTYVRVLIRRKIDCGEKSESNMEAIFYDSDGNVVDNYMNFKKEPSLKPADAGTVGEAVINFICGEEGQKENES